MTATSDPLSHASAPSTGPPLASPTTADAERLAADLATFLGATRSSCSPRGRRCRSSGSAHRSRRWVGGCAPCGTCATPSALRGGRRPGPRAGAAPRPPRGGRRADRGAPGERRRPGRSRGAAGSSGYRREYQVEHRGELAVRGSIVDVFPSTADAPVRIDLWGDEVERLTEFSVSDQRSDNDVDEVEIFPCRELLPTDEVRERAEGWSATEPWGREQWERLADGQSVRRHGVVAAVARRRRRPHVCSTSAPTPRWCWSTRAACATGPPTSWPRRPIWPPRSPARGVSATTEPCPAAPRLRAPARPHDRAGVDHDRHARGSRRRHRGRRMGWFPVVGDGEGWSTSCASCSTTATASWWRPTAPARPSGSTPLRAGCSLPVAPTGHADLTEPGGHVVTAPLDRGCILPRPSWRPGRGRPHRSPPAHRPARPRKRQAPASSTTSRPGDYVVHHQHGVGRYQGMVKRTIGGAERDYLLLEYRGGDKLYVPSDQIDAVRHYTGGDTPALTSLGGARLRQAPRPRCAPRCARSPRSWWCSTRSGCTPRPRLRPGHAVAARDGGGLPLRGDARPAQGHRRRQGRHGASVPDGPPGVRRRRVRQDRGGHPRRVQGGPGRQAGGVLVPTTLLATQHYQTFSDRFARLPGAGRGAAQPLPHRQARPSRWPRASTGEVDVVIGTHRLLAKDIEFKDLGLLVVDEEQRFGVPTRRRSSS
jgi:transcription-repair coupling factor (superfamily II helicase)